ncbi:CPBP family intramembrane glutamic endopeptidase [Pricia sp. S334]|uniref:CPBP family intramembrane glutamic endopeptidase n=1 Tax=Pricia mediterranea TaxID=3076079 RepID=A0ABU3L736_9FLAO|nr:CPBP family intramembrane glutamic endopeptidase [Pricia sp. S334]MDT7829564.1 CPBP family intramembrane glutamic endopeptidase [Pricia sp. S334]
MHEQVRKTILLFLGILTLLSAICYYAILKLNPTSIYVGALMMCPALSAFITLKLMKRPISILPWGLKRLKYLRLSYLIPVGYITISYTLIWVFGFGNVPNQETITEWSQELGMGGFSSSFVLLTMIVLLSVVGVVKNIGSTLGEEIGWRGFLIYELRKLFSFGGVSMSSGLIWAIWHWPIIYLVYRGSGNLIFHIAAFTVMIMAISIILAYFTFKSNSLWPAALFHSVHNIFIQKIFTPLTITNESSTFWIDEYGLMLPIITTIIAIYFWRRAKVENL